VIGFDYRKHQNDYRNDYRVADVLAIYMAVSEKTHEARHPGMKARRAAFVREFLVDGNATQAAIRAGYSPKSAVHSAKRLLRMPAITEAIAKAQAEAARRNEITVDRVLQELSRIAFHDPSKIVTVTKRQGIKITPTEDLDDDHRRCVESVGESQHGLRIKLLDKTRALELLGKYLGMWVERHEITGDEGGPLVVVQSQGGE